MDIKKEREAFEAVFPCSAGTVLNEYGHYESQINRQDAMIQNISWVVWQAAKAQAVPEWISTSDRMPKEGEEVLVHSLGQVRQVTRDSKWAGGFKERNCYGWQAAYGQSHWMPKSVELPEQYHFYYENDAKQKAMIEAQEPTND
jgi:hypothetical protein